MSLAFVKPSGRFPHLSEKLNSGWAGEFHITGTEADLVLSVGQTVDSHKRALWVDDLRGKVGWRPRDNMLRMRLVLQRCAVIAEALGASELRIECEARDGWQKTILPRLGFEAICVNQKPVYRLAV